MADNSDPSANGFAEAVSGETGETRIALFEEEVSVSKRVVPTGRVQVSRITQRHEQLIDELLKRKQIEIERIPVDKPVDTMPFIREDEDTVVIPVVEEVVRVERRLLLKEEIRIQRVRATERFQESVALRKQEAVVTRLPTDPPAASGVEAETDLNLDKEEKNTHEQL